MAEKAAMNIECWLPGLWVLTYQRVTHTKRDARFYFLDERGILNRIQSTQKIPIVMTPESGSNVSCSVSGRPRNAA